MKLIPILTEKSLEEAKKGNYTFWVDRKMTKHRIKKLVSEVFDVSVSSVRTLNYKKEVKKTITGRKREVPGGKKTVVTLKGKDKIDLFEEKKSK